MRLDEILAQFLSKSNFSIGFFYSTGGGGGGGIVSCTTGLGDWPTAHLSLIDKKIS